MSIYALTSTAASLEEPVEEGSEAYKKSICYCRVFDLCVVQPRCRRVIQVGTRLRGGEAQIDLAAHSRSVTGRSSKVNG